MRPLFAEPEVDEARGQVDWYSDRDGTIERFDEADSETQRAVAERLTQLIDEIGTQGGDPRTVRSDRR